MKVLCMSTCVQVVSALYTNKIASIQTMLQEIEEWMGDRKYTKLEDFRGKMSKEQAKNLWAYERAQLTNGNYCLKPKILSRQRRWCKNDR